MFAMIQASYLAPLTTVWQSPPEERPPPRMPTLMHGVIAGSLDVRDTTPLRVHVVAEVMHQTVYN
jgi:hypothetical protein